MTLWRLPLLILLASQYSCTEPTQKIWQDYQARLSRITGAQFPELATTARPALPAISTLRHPVTEQQLSLLDLLALRSCGLDQLVSERNSSLGKVQTISQRFAYEVAFMQQVKPCLLSGSLSAELTDKLRQISLIKQQELPALWHNLLLTDPTLRQQWQPAAEGLPLSGQPGLTESLQALQQLLAIQQLLLSQDWGQLNQRHVEAPLALLYQSGYFSRWLRSLYWHLSALHTTQAGLNAVPVQQFCPAGKSHGNTEKLTNVLSQVFILRIQQPLAELDGAYQQFWPLLTALYQQTALWPALQQRVEQPIQELKHQLRLHVSWWQQVQQHCAAPAASRKEIS
ncbi:DUF3080 family protein [Rheinheimera sp.]|uniref:DUF3080 family protein n=1 Tax=Rheinheimera sp. TaxID=1869214 RepID=UPI00307EE6B2